MAHFYRDIEVTKLDWPSYSPDLNAIELAWNTLKQQVRKYPIVDLDHLAEVPGIV